MKAYFLLGALLCGSISGQTLEATAPPIIRTDVQEVMVPVVVTDKKDHHVAGLKAADFVVYEDGVRQKITSFRTSIDSADELLNLGPSASSRAGAAKVNPGDPRRTYLICIDTLHTEFANFGRVRTALLKFFEQEQSFDSQYALVALGREPKMIQDSTRDASAVVAAIRKDTFVGSILDSEAAKLNSEAASFTELMKKYCGACVCANYVNLRVDTPACNSRTSSVQSALNNFAERNWVFTESFLEGLKKLVDVTAQIPTIRTIILVSDGYNRFPGRELRGILAGFAPKNRSFEFSPRDTEPRLREILKIAVMNDVRFYTLDSRGVYTQSSVAGGGGFDASQGLGQQPRGAPVGAPAMADLQALSVARENTDALARLAQETGGLFVQNNNDMLRGIRRAFTDSREYYLLGYSAKQVERDNSYRKISVEVSDKKYIVHAKAGYYAR